MICVLAVLIGFVCAGYKGRTGFLSGAGQKIFYRVGASKIYSRLNKAIKDSQLAESHTGMAHLPINM